jgi:hypothetical protein
LVAPSGARLSEDVPESAAECQRIRHGVPHEAGEDYVGVNHRKLSAFLCRIHVYALGLEAWAEGVPVGERRKEHDALSVHQTSTGVPADGAVEKLLVLIELYDVIAWGGIRHHSIPGLTMRHRCLRSGGNLLADGQDAARARVRSRGDADDLISVCGDEKDGNLPNAWTVKPTGLITIRRRNRRCELPEEHPLDDRLKPVLTFTSSPFVT